MRVAKNRVVSLRYSMKNAAGEEIENILAGPAVQYLHGSGNILPQLEAELEGLQSGDKTSLFFSAPDFFHFEVVIDDVRLATSSEMALGKPVKPGECGPEGCC